MVLATCEAEITRRAHSELSTYSFVRSHVVLVVVLVESRITGQCAYASVASSAGLASALTGIGIPVAVPLGVVGSMFSVVSSGLIVVRKKLDKDMSKHQEIVTLGLAKRASVDRLVSKAINDNRLSDVEFQIILSELEQYNALKEKVRSKLTKNRLSVNCPRLMLKRSKEKPAHRPKQSFKKSYKISSLVPIEICKQKTIFTYYKIMILAFKTLMLLANEYYTPSWHRD